MESEVYYAREAALDAGYDALCIEYNGHHAARRVGVDDLPIYVGDALAAMEACGARAYGRLVFCSKSLGTLVAGEAARRVSGARQFFMTPLDRTLPYLSDAPCVVVAGSADDALSPQGRAAAVAAPRVSVRVIEGADHSLEYRGDVGRSLDALREATGLFKDFLGEK